MSFEFPGDNKRCDHCDQPGVPYEYMGRTFSGLVPNEGERLCPRCNGFKHDQFVAELADRPLQIWIPPELAGVDGRDMASAARRLTRRTRKQSGGIA